MVCSLCGTNVLRTYIHSRTPEGSHVQDTSVGLYEAIEARTFEEIRFLLNQLILFNSHN